MFRLLTIASFFLCQLLGNPIPVDAESAGTNAHPWLVSIQANGSHICGGSIISESVILTAAHCTVQFPLNVLSVRAAGSRNSVHKVVATKLHENYKNEFFHASNDLALIKVSPSFGTDVRNVRLASRGYVVAKGTAVSIVSNVLRDNSLSVVENAECDGKYASRLNLDSQICVTTSPGTCLTRASGDPLMVGDVQVGLITEVLCVLPQNPKSYDRIAFHRDWIERNLRVLDPRSSR